MLRNYQENDEGKINQLFYEVFKTNRSIAEWQWKFSHPTNHRSLISVYEEGGEIIGHAALLIFEGQIESRPVLFGERVDVMVHPGHQGKGMYKKVIHHLMQQCEEHNIDLVYGYPAPKAKDLFIRYMDGKEITYVPRLLKVLSPGKLIMSRFGFLQKASLIFNGVDKVISNKRRSLPDALSVTQIDHADIRFDEIWEEGRKDHSILLTRNASFINWRYISHPSREYEVYIVENQSAAIGYIVLKKEIMDKGNETMELIHVIDLFFSDRGQNRKDMSNALHHITKRADLVSTWSLPNTAQDQLFKKSAFIRVSSPMPLVGKTMNKELDDSFIYNSANWYVSQGDVDSY
ncbi:GNAT family N-acetyltransferase [Jeotgalibacillus sp. ET6]|uniref:GNAT family N-acetyltransferase n=1 Tax=Jeotgalibacillus sp. ET6 TaxID=3037260 RepID=UPI0024188E49|nr:GNAT family N-acetyltransferase [Jeotgalibacillus sp. ET6]MDG5471576.1 GNAT family N-acetyltransferase [Jeotgalibacillus sp. ET6]